MRMPRRPDQTSPAHSPPTAPAASALTGLSDDQVARWADLIADGRDGFPDGLPSPDHERLLAAVRQRLRRRLVALIARAIAERLHRLARLGTEDPTDA
jgi:hypothetical protein